MNDDTQTVYALLQRVVCGDMPRRDFLRTMLSLGVSGPLLAQMLATVLPASAQTPARSPQFTPTRRGGGGKLRLLWWQGPTILNPHLSTGTKDFDAARVVYEPLAAFDADANFVPVLAAEIPSYTNGGLAKDGTAVTWKLKPGVTWHDGKPFTADDVIFTWEFAADAYFAGGGAPPGPAPRGGGGAPGVPGATTGIAAPRWHIPQFTAAT